MGVNLGKLTAYITANADGVATGIRGATKQFESFGYRVRSVFGKLTGSFTGLSAALGLGAITAGVGRLISRMDELQDTAEMLGVSAGKLWSLSGAADQSGTSLEAVAKAMTRISKETGSGDPLGLLQGVAEQVAAAKSPAEALAIAMKKLGKAGGELVPFLRELAASPPGASLSDADIKRWADLADTWAKIKHDTLTLTVKLLGDSGAIKFVDFMISNTGAMNAPVGAFNSGGKSSASIGAQWAQGWDTGRSGGASGGWETAPKPKPKGRFEGPGWVYSGTMSPWVGGGATADQPRMDGKKKRSPWSGGDGLGGLLTSPIPIGSGTQKILGPTMDLLRWMGSPHPAQQRRTDFRGEALERGGAAANQAITQLMNQHNDKQLAVQIQSKEALNNVVNILGGLAGNLGLAVI
jgi:hypothetical protein